jgi:hypothetical protein
MFNNRSNTSLTNVTFVNNSAGVNGGGMSNFDNSSTTLTNAIFWGNTPDQIFNNDSSSTAITYSDIQGGSTGTGNINADPLLMDLADNGGFTMTHALSEGSPAIDAGNTDDCPIIDQRGYHRPIDGDGNGIAICDMGAYEYGSFYINFNLNTTITGEGQVIVEPQKDYYDFGDWVTLTPMPSSGWSFSDWSGDASGSDNPLTIEIEGNMSITAYFIQDKYTLTVNIFPESSGSVDINPMQVTYHFGDQVTLTPNANVGWKFLDWSGDVTGTDNPKTIEIQGNTSITTNFIKNPFTIYLPLILTGN